MEVPDRNTEETKWRRRLRSTAWRRRNPRPDARRSPCHAVPRPPATASDAGEAAAAAGARARASKPAASRRGADGRAGPARRRDPTLPPLGRTGVRQGPGLLIAAGFFPSGRGLWWCGHRPRRAGRTSSAADARDGLTLKLMMSEPMRECGGKGFVERFGTRYHVCLLHLFLRQHAFSTYQVKSTCQVQNTCCYI